MTLHEYQYAGKKWVLTDRPFQRDRDGNLKTGLRIPGIAREDMAPGIIFELTRDDLDKIDFGDWLRRGRVLPYIEPPPKPVRRGPARHEAVKPTEPEPDEDGDGDG